MSDLLIRGGTILDPRLGVRAADVRVEDGRIIEVAPVLEPASGTPVLDAEGKLLMPGLINAHTHSGQALNRGSTPDLPLDVWLARIVFADVDRDPDDAYTTAAAGALEMLRTGCTSVLDHVSLAVDHFAEHGEAVISAYRDVGIRAAVAPMIADLGHVASWPLHLLDDTGDAEPPKPMHDPVMLAGLMAGFIEQYTESSPRINPMLGPNAPQRCTDEYLALNADMAARYDVGVHTHLLETKSQLVATRHRFGGSVVDHLDRLGLLGGRTSLAHGVWVPSADIHTIARRGSVVVHNPVSNLRLGSGVMPMQEMLAAGVNIAIGADGAASNDAQNMFEAWKLGTSLHTLRGSLDSWPTPSTVWRNMLSAGARAVGFDVGAIRRGALADLAVLRLDHHVLADAESLATSLAFAEQGRSVETVIVQGRVVWTEGRSAVTDDAAIGERARAFQRRLHDTSAERYDAVRDLEDRAIALEAAVAAIDTGEERRLTGDRPPDG